MWRTVLMKTGLEQNQKAVLLESGKERMSFSACFYLSNCNESTRSNILLDGSDLLFVLGAVLSRKVIIPTNEILIKGLMRLFCSRRKLLRNTKKREEDKK
ncbi:hypothetical protein CDAR_236131 [Caerostris darwini]|uniref:Uncharacterized protein n=1 Tax=Caerostris darwini TaxID=1538125 RepID=A0AAV4QPS6_9ARAC|nr:hypothetical protein CDAR_236131 [Caerostris darwini]